MNVGNYGNTIYFGTGFNGAGFDMAAYTDLTLTFTGPDKSTTFAVSVADGVTLGSTDQAVRGGTFDARQYVIYAFLAGQITLAGRWTVRLTYAQDTASPPISFTSDIGSFVVGT